MDKTDFTIVSREGGVWIECSESGKDASIKCRPSSEKFVFNAYQGPAAPAVCIDHPNFEERGPHKWTRLSQTQHIYIDNGLIEASQMS